MRPYQIADVLPIELARRACQRLPSRVCPFRAAFLIRIRSLVALAEQRNAGCEIDLLEDLRQKIEESEHVSQGLYEYALGQMTRIQVSLECRGVA